MKYLLPIVFAVFIIGCKSPALSFEDVLCITDVDIVDGEQGLVENQTVVIKDGRIIYIGDDTPLSLEGDSQTIVADGKFMIPGLWDAHVHFAYIEELAPKMFDLFMAYGITSVRDTGGDLNFVLKWKYLSEKNPTTAPRIKVAGPLLDGNPNVYDGSSPSRPKLSIKLDNTQDVLMNADILIEAGVDFLKAYEMLTPEQFKVINNYAKGQNLKVTGHVPLSMDVISASDAGFDSMEHLRNLELSCASNSEELLEIRRKMLAEGIKNKDSGHAIRSRLHAAQRIEAIANQDDSKTEAVLDALLRNQTWQVPTLALVTASAERHFESQDWKSTFDFLPDDIATRFNDGVNQFSKVPVSDDSRAFANWGYEMTKKIHDKGIGIMAGTDCPIFFFTPGRSLHQELAELSKSGIPPLEVLKTATTRPAEYFNMQDELGLVKKGFLADLVLLDANPLDDIQNTQKISAVIKGGQYHDRADLMSKIQ